LVTTKYTVSNRVTVIFGTKWSVCVGWFNSSMISLTN